MSARRSSGAVGSGIVALLLCATAHAQSHRSTLTIHVVDPTGALVPGARVATAPRDARLLITRETDSAGDASFDELLPSTYVVEINATGFAPATRVVQVRGGATCITVSLE